MKSFTQATKGLGGGSVASKQLTINNLPQAKPTIPSGPAKIAAKKIVANTADDTVESDESDVVI